MERETAINSQILILEKKLPRSNRLMMFIHQMELSIVKLSNHLENIPKVIPNKKTKQVLIILFFNCKLSSTFLILFNNSFIFTTYLNSNLMFYKLFY